MNFCLVFEGYLSKGKQHIYPPTFAWSKGYPRRQTKHLPTNVCLVFEGYPQNIYPPTQRSKGYLSEGKQNIYPPTQTDGYPERQTRHLPTHPDPRWGSGFQPPTSQGSRSWPGNAAQVVSSLIGMQATQRAETLARARPCKDDGLPWG